VTKKLKQFAEEKRISGKEGKEKSSVNDVAQMVKRMPQYQKELNNYATHMHLAEDCMREYQHKVAEICKVEQVSFCLPFGLHTFDIVRFMTVDDLCMFRTWLWAQIPIMKELGTR